MKQYMGYTIEREGDHVKITGPSGVWREDSITDAFREINRIKGTPIERYAHARVLRENECNKAYTRKEINEYNGMD